MRCVQWVALLSTAALLSACAAGPEGGAKKQRLTDAEEQEVEVWREGVRRQTEVKREMVDILKTVENRASMERALEALRKLNVRVEAVVQEVGDQVRKLGRASEAVHDAVDGSPEQAAFAQVQQAELEEVRRILRLPNGEEFFDAVKGLKKKANFP